MVEGDVYPVVACCGSVHESPTSHSQPIPFGHFTVCYGKLPVNRRCMDVYNMNKHIEHEIKLGRFMHDMMTVIYIYIYIYFYIYIYIYIYI